MLEIGYPGRVSGARGETANGRMGDASAPDSVGRKTRRVEDVANRLNHFAPVLSRAVGVPARLNILSPGRNHHVILGHPPRCHIHGAAQNRRGFAGSLIHTLGAPSFSPHRIREHRLPLGRHQKRHACSWRFLTRVSLVCFIFLIKTLNLV